MVIRSIFPCEMYKNLPKDNSVILYHPFKALRKQKILQTDSVILIVSYLSHVEPKTKDKILQLPIFFCVKTFKLYITLKRYILHV